MGPLTVAVERIDLEWLLRRWEDLALELVMRDNTEEPQRCPSCKHEFSARATVLDQENDDDRRTVARLRHALGMVPT